MNKTRRGFFGALLTVVGAIFVPKSGAMPVKFVLEDSYECPRYVAGTTSHSIAAADDLLVTGLLEVDDDDDRAFDFHHANKTNPVLYIHL